MRRGDESSIRPVYCRDCNARMPNVMPVGLPKGGMVFACKYCGEMHLNDLASEWYEGRIEGLDEFWMTSKVRRFNYGP